MGFLWVREPIAAENITFQAYTKHYAHTSRFVTMTSSNGNIFRVIGHLCGEFTGPRRIPRTEASDAELLLWSATE